MDEIVLVQVERRRGRGPALHLAREGDRLAGTAVVRLPRQRRLALVELAAPRAGLYLVAKEVVVGALAADVVARVRLEARRVDAWIEPQADAARVRVGEQRRGVLEQRERAGLLVSVETSRHEEPAIEGAGARRREQRVFAARLDDGAEVRDLGDAAQGLTPARR